MLQQKIRNELALNDKDYVLPQYFYDGTLVYSHFDRLGGLVSYLNKTFRAELIDMLGEEAANAVAPDLTDSSRPIVQSDMSICKRACVWHNEKRVSQTFLRLDSAMFLITGASGSSTSSTSLANMASTSTTTERISPGFQMQHPILEQLVRRCKDIQPGSIDPLRSVNELLDCCIMYYYAVAHKYIVMVSYIYKWVSDNFEIQN